MKKLIAVALLGLGMSGCAVYPAGPVSVGVGAAYPAPVYRPAPYYGYGYYGYRPYWGHPHRRW